MGICVKFRSGAHMMLKDDAVLPPAVIEDINAYQAECRLLDILKNAGYRAGYSLDDENYPVVLHITIPAGKDMGGYPDKDEYLTITPIANEPSCHKFEISQKLTEPSAQSPDIVFFPKRDFKIGFLSRLAERYDLWKYRRTVKYLKNLLPSIYKHLPTR